MTAMFERDVNYTLSGRVDIDDTYLGGELIGSKADWWAETKRLLLPKSPTVDTALSFDDSGHPLYTSNGQVFGFRISRSP
ncbi:hypothetical protein [Methylovulum psychrotolerans]|uniref:Uncharacterized protein n=1 Tax=Methylovulum psychrotolerans TaxID=1704499 RepID=A0A2S5CGQ8_9GAMM|nr:hypothetical protein AADEFJLK_04254 [Methylovulum psychrotolerans]